MSSVEPLGAGRIEPRELEQEMRSSFLDYAMSVIVARALPDVRDGLKPVHRRVLYRDERARAAAESVAYQVRARRRRGDGEVPPARQSGDLRQPGADGAVVLAALHTGRPAGELRQHRRLPGRSRSLHGVSPGADGDGVAAGHRRRHGRLRAELRRLAAGAVGLAIAVPESARQRLSGHRGRYGHEHPATQLARSDRRARRDDR